MSTLAAQPAGGPAVTDAATRDDTPVRPAHATRDPLTRPVRIALLGLGTVGSAVARLAADVSLDGRAIRVTGALVRDPDRPRHTRVPSATSLDRVLADAPEIAVEALGGIEPARSLVLECLRRGVHVVTANKSLIAAHGDELREAARQTGVQLRDEAAVVAGVPFLGTFARRPLASEVSSVTGILNGTSHYILTAVARGEAFHRALAGAQRLGLAEPDPVNDVDGIDAAEKLAILARLLGRVRLTPSSIPRRSISAVTPDDLEHAAALGGTIKPIACASWSGNAVDAFVEPAFVPTAHPLASISGLTNGVLLASASGSMFYAGPGAGPDVTARTILDDVAEVARGERLPSGAQAVEAAVLRQPDAHGWLLRVSSPLPLPPGPDLADLLAAHGVFVRRGSESAHCLGGETRWLLTWPVLEGRVADALDALTRAARCATARFRALEAQHAW